MESILFATFILLCVTLQCCVGFFGIHTQAGSYEYKEMGNFHKTKAAKRYEQPRDGTGSVKDKRVRNARDASNTKPTYKNFN